MSDVVLRCLYWFAAFLWACVLASLVASVLIGGCERGVGEPVARYRTRDGEMVVPDRPVHRDGNGYHYQVGLNGKEWMTGE